MLEELIVGTVLLGLTNTGMFLWWGSKINTLVLQHDKTIGELGKLAAGASLARLADAISRLEQRLDSLGNK